jgi:hypothetical protein
VFFFRRSPAGKQTQGFLGARARLGRIRDDRQAGVGGELYSVVAEFQLADDRMLETLLTLVVQPDAVGRPVTAKLLASG